MVNLAEPRLVMNSQLVTLVMPCFIRDQDNLIYFQEALDSALLQTYPNLEILVIDDGSPLGDEVRELDQLKDPRARYIRKANGGVASALNVGLKEMNGEYFTWLSHDDLYLPDKISLQMEAAVASPDCSVFYCDVDHIDQSGNHIFFEETPELTPAEQYAFHVQYGCFNANSYLINRRCFEKVGEFDITRRTTQDNHMWIRIMRHFHATRIPKTLIKYRHHPTQDSRSEIHLRECNELYIYFLDNICQSEIPTSNGLTPARYFAECACYRQNRGYEVAAKHARSLSLRQFFMNPITEWENRNLILGLTLIRPLKNLLKKIKPLFKKLIPSGVQPRALKHHLVEHLKTNQMILGGPFAGIEFPYDPTWLGNTAKLLGVYEIELQGALKKLGAVPFPVIINIGSADGYYALGSGKLWPAAKIITYETEEYGRKLMEEFAVKNNSFERIESHGKCDQVEFINVLSRFDHGLVVMDIEGGEDELLSGENLIHLKNFHLLVELHDIRVDRLGEKLRERFETTHDILEIITRPRRLGDFSYPRNIFIKLYFLEQLRDLSDEGRGAPMRWFLMVPKR